MNSYLNIFGLGKNFTFYEYVNSKVIKIEDTSDKAIRLDEIVVNVRVKITQGGWD